MASTQHPLASICESQELTGDVAIQPVWDEYFSEEARLLKASALADLVNQFLGVEDVVTLHAGLPSNESFPLHTIHACTQPLISAHSHVAGMGVDITHPTATTLDAALVAHHKPPARTLTTNDPLSHAALVLSASSSASSKAGAGTSLEGSYSSLNSCPSDPGSGSEDAACSTPPGMSPLPTLAAASPSHLSTVLQHAGSCTAATPVGAECGSETRPQRSGEHQPHASTSQSAPQVGAGSEMGAIGMPAVGVVPLAHVHIGGQLVADAQQYMFHSGHPPLLHWVRGVTQRCHSPPQTTECAITSGAVHALNCAISVLCDRGDFVVCEEFAYTHAPECVFKPRGLRMLPVAMDAHGMIPSALREVLAAAGTSPATGRPPRVMYIIPAGQNPTGAIMPPERKREIYGIARAAGLIILEDDAYYWLQYPRGPLPPAHQPGLHLPASFLSLDVDGRVLRIDTFAKLLGPGYRLGWVAGHPTLVAKVAQAVQASSCGPSSLAQVVVSELLGAWGMAGFEVFLQRQQALYARRAALASAAAAKHLRGLAEWRDPVSGMFMWLRLTGVRDVGPELVAALVAARVVVVPGRPFWTDLAKAEGGAPCPYVRVTFGAVPEEMMEAGFERLATALRAAAVAESAADAAAAATDTAAAAAAAGEAAAAAAATTAAAAEVHTATEPMPIKTRSLSPLGLDGLDDAHWRLACQFSRMGIAGQASRRTSVSLGSSPSKERIASSWQGPGRMSAHGVDELRRSSVEQGARTSVEVPLGC